MDVIPAVTTITSAGQADFFHHLRMTGNTFYRLVLTGQRESGLFVVIKSPFLPCACIVTGFTLVTEPAPMIVITPMTGNTGNRRISIGLFLVTRLAFRFRMLAEQGECCQTMIEGSALPASLIMTVVALFPFLALMHVVALVTRVTGLAQLLFAQYPLMAGGTFDAIMFSAQRKPGFFGMIVNGPGPGLLAVTGFALPAKLSFMALAFVVLPMTGVTLLWCIFVILGLVTRGALHIAMFSS